MAGPDNDKTPLALPVQAQGPGGSGFHPPQGDPDRTPIALPAIGADGRTRNQDRTPVALPAAGAHAPVADHGPRASHAKLTKRIGAYEVTAILGKGGMGTVFLARQEGLDRQVALKVLSTSISQDRVFIERFQFEARASAQLNHPNIVQGIDVGRDEATGFWYFAMEYVDGPSLKQVLAEQGALPERRALEIIRDMARALECAARHGIVHRDVKPDNILLAPSGDAKLTDLGLARSVYKDKGVTHSGETVGTPFYMAPEQIMGQSEKIDIRTDIYSLGATLYHLVVGKPPYQGEAAAVIMTKHLKEKIPQAHKDSPAVSEACARLIAKMMGKEQVQRFQTPTELLETVEKILLREPTTVARPGFGKLATSNPRLQAMRRGGARREGGNLLYLAALGFGGLILMAALLYWLLTMGETAQPEPHGEKSAPAADPAKKTQAPAKTVEERKSASAPAADPKQTERALLRFDFETGELPGGFTLGVPDMRRGADNSRGCIKAVSTPKNLYFHNEIEFEDRKGLFKITDKTWFSMQYFTTTQRNLKIQMAVTDGAEQYNIGLVLDSVAENKWNTLRLRMVDAFRANAGSGALIKPNVLVRVVTVFSGRPETPSDLYIDNLAVTEAP